MSLTYYGVDTESGAKLYKCDECDSMYGTFDREPVEHCTRCEHVKEIATLKQKVTDAQIVGLQLYRAIMKHEYDTQLEFDPTDVDRELWECLTKYTPPNDSPSGIIAILPETIDE